MKNLYLLACLFGLLHISAFTNAQSCTGSQQISYDTSFYGAGNNLYNFSFPKFDPSIGTLAQVDISLEVTLKYNFELENKEAVSVNTYRVRVGRDDEISGAAILSPILFSSQKTYGYFPLAASDGITGSGPDFTAQGPLMVLNHTVNSQSISNTADYLGTGNVSLDYLASTYSTVFGSVNYSYNANALDTVLMKVTYLYCPASFLPANLTAFSAQKDGTGQVSLQWTVQNEEMGRIYEVQKSVDGHSFVTAGRLNSSPNGSGSGLYRYTYRPKERENGRMLFRIRQVESNGTEKFSAIRIVDTGIQSPSSGMQLYPNPSSGPATLVFSRQDRSDWQVDVLSSSGTLVKQLQFRNALAGKLNTDNSLSKGLYLLRIRNLRTGAVFTQQWLRL